MLGEPGASAATRSRHELTRRVSGRQAERGPAPGRGPARLTFAGRCPILGAMGQDRARSYADRLPRIVAQEEEDISHLSDEMADILYPGRRPRPFRMGVVFGPFEGPEYERAVAAARTSPVYRSEGEGRWLRHRAEFGTESAARLRDLFDLVGARPGTDVLVDGKPVPYAREIWLPLFWLFVREEA